MNMNSLSNFEELDRVIDGILARSETPTAAVSPDVAELAAIASELRHLPRTDFKARLRMELEWQIAGRCVMASPQQKNTVVEAHGTGAAPLFGKTTGLYPVRPVNLAASLALHAALLLFMGMGLVMVKSTQRVTPLTASGVTRLDPYISPASLRESHRGGGGGGAADRIHASQGPAPRFAREQLAPPVVLPEVRPILQVESTIVGPPDLNLPQISQAGDPLSRLLVPSAGTGVHGGIGDNEGGGDGIGHGSGRGPGSRGGCCNGIYTVGDGVSSPRVIFKPEPDYSDEARKIRLQGVVVVSAVVAPDGRPTRLRIARSLGMGLDEKALEAVNRWRFEPARKDGQPVAVQISIEVDFHIFY
jgi:TonB family protein